MILLSSYFATLMILSVASLTRDCFAGSYAFEMDSSVIALAELIRSFASTLRSYY